MAIRSVRPLVAKIRAQDRDLARQLVEAMTSVVLNLGEAEGQDGGHRRERIKTARGSAKEARNALLAAEAWGYVRLDEIAAVDEKLDTVLAKTWRWLHG